MGQAAAGCRGRPRDGDHTAAGDGAASRPLRGVGRLSCPASTAWYGLPALIADARSHMQHEVSIAWVWGACVYAYVWRSAGVCIPPYTWDTLLSMLQTLAMNPAAWRRPSMSPTWAASVASCGRTCASTRSAPQTVAVRCTKSSHDGRPASWCRATWCLCDRTLVSLSTLLLCSAALSTSPGNRRWLLLCQKCCATCPHLKTHVAAPMGEVFRYTAAGHVHQLGPGARTRIPQHLDARVHSGSGRQGRPPRTRPQARGAPFRLMSSAALNEVFSAKEILPGRSITVSIPLNMQIK